MWGCELHLKFPVVKLAERVAALRCLGFDLVPELMEFTGVQGGDLVLGGGDTLFQLRNLADQADQFRAYVFAGDGFGALFVVVQQDLHPSEIAGAVGGVEVVVQTRMIW